VFLSKGIKSFLQLNNGQEIEADRIQPECEEAVEERRWGCSSLVGERKQLEPNRRGRSARLGFAAAAQSCFCPATTATPGFPWATALPPKKQPNSTRQSPRWVRQAPLGTPGLIYWVPPVQPGSSHRRPSAAANGECSHDAARLKPLWQQFGVVILDKP
jgi:hypothetical protein